MSVVFPVARGPKRKKLFIARRFGSLSILVYIGVCGYT
jgi:hypothetical protein